MDGMVNKALKGAAVGAGVCLVYWAGKQFVSRTPPSRFELLNAAANDALSADMEVHALCRRLAAYKHVDEVQFTHLLVSWAKLITLHMQLVRKEVAPQIGTPRRVASLTAIIVEALRTMRAKLAARIPSALHEYDEVAADFQRKVNEYTYNITKMVDYTMSK